MLGDDLRSELGDALPTDVARQGYALDLLRELLPTLTGAEPLVLDLGCGRGDHVDVVREVRPGAHWIGVDIEGSAEVGERRRDDAEFRSFDGEAIPADDDSIDLVYCQQVFEHVVRPEPLIADVARILKPGGIFCGSVSQLEPFHSRSVGGFTPYGWKLAVERAGLRLDEVRPGIDAGTLALRRLLGRRGHFDRYWVAQSPGNRLLALAARTRKADAATTNALQLMFAGQFTFTVTKPTG